MTNSQAENAQDGQDAHADRGAAGHAAHASQGGHQAPAGQEDYAGSAAHAARGGLADPGAQGGHAAHAAGQDCYPGQGAHPAQGDYAENGSAGHAAAADEGGSAAHGGQYGYPGSDGRMGTVGPAGQGAPDGPGEAVHTHGPSPAHEAGDPETPDPAPRPHEAPHAPQEAENREEPHEDSGPRQPDQDGGAAGASTRRLAQAVEAAEQALIEFEIAVETFRVEVENFSRLHHQRLGPMYSRLDELDAQIAEAIAARTGAPEDVRKAREARAAVLPMPDVEELFHGWMGSEGLYPEAEAMLTEQSVRPPQKVRPSEEARRVYRDLVRKAHPDLARDEAERGRRDAFIVRVNAAYGAGDEAALRELAREWEAGPVPQQQRLSESEELYARLEWLSARKEMLAAVAAELEEGAIGAMIKMAPEDPDALLEEIAEKLLADVAEREAYLAQLVG